MREVNNNNLLVLSDYYLNPTDNIKITWKSKQIILYNYNYTKSHGVKLSLKFMYNMKMLKKIRFR